jgi:hypothetical protein
MLNVSPGSPLAPPDDMEVITSPAPLAMAIKVAPATTLESLKISANLSKAGEAYSSVTKDINLKIIKMEINEKIIK